MSTVRAVVVDDSILIRKIIAAILSMDDEIRIVGEAGNGLDAVRRVVALKPDIVIMDIQMPVMNGFEAIGEIMAQNPVPILVVSSLGDAATAFRAISLGALEVMSKADIDIERPDKLLNKVKYLSGVKVICHMRRCAKGKEPAAALHPVAAVPRSFGVVAFAASTGGPKALSAILPALPEDFPWPIVVAQHMACGFADGMADWLGKISRVSIKVADESEAILPGWVYFSPPEKNLTLVSGHKTRLSDPQPEDIYHPSCDALLASVAAVCGRRTVGIILTGMGNDGVRGMERIKAAGGFTIAQDQSSSVVFGMPKKAIESNCVDKVLPLSEIAGEIVRLVNKTRQGA